MNIASLRHSIRAALIAAASVLSPIYSAIPALAQERPNIIVILADDLGYGDIGAFGGQLVSTPELDRMAREGVMFTDYYAPANVCTPSRAGLLTGRHPVRMGLAEGVIFPESTHGLPPDEITIAEHLKSVGYSTMMVGKWHLGHTPELLPTRQGFDGFFGVPYSNDMSPFPLYRGETIIDEEVVQKTLTRRYTEAAIDFMDASGDEPYFLYLAHTFPHIPLHASDEFSGRSEAGLYGDTVEEIDWSTGEILNRARESDRPTLIVFTSDNGPWFEGSSGVSRDRKGSTWDGAYRVPFLAWWPGRLEAGTQISEPVTGLDLLPTLAALVGHELPQDIAFDGEDLSPLLAGEAFQRGPIVFFNEDQIAAIRDGDWRLVRRSYYKTYDVPLGALGYPLLFDLSRDPSESYSVAERFPEQTSKLVAHAKQIEAQLGIEPKITLTPEDPEE